MIYSIDETANTVPETICNKQGYHLLNHSLYLIIRELPRYLHKNDIKMASD